MKTAGLAVCFVGEGDSNQSAIFESYNLAKVWTLAAIFVVEDNGHAESTASSYSVGSAQVGRGEGLALPCSEMDGSDFFAVYEVAGTQSRGSARAAAPASSIRACCATTAPGRAQS
jgi:TPP-dependent pyruvate/acetoin dehydrogenase alpha subunit